MSVKQMKPFMTNVFLNAENEISDFLVASIKMTFKLRGLINQEFKFIDKI
jgi:hypothetical protein